MREITVADLEAELARRGTAPGGEEPPPEAHVVLLVPRDSPFEAYVVALDEGIEASRKGGAPVTALRIDTAAEPHAPRRFGLSGAPGLVIFLNGRQVAAFAVPIAGEVAPLIGRVVQGLASALRGFLPPPPGGRAI